MDGATILKFFLGFCWMPIFSVAAVILVESGRAILKGLEWVGLVLLGLVYGVYRRG